MEISITMGYMYSKRIHEMKKVFLRNCLLLPVAAAVLFFTACSFGLEPAKSGADGKTTVSFSFSNVNNPASAAAGRAIVPGSKYLYLRFDGTVYGPYTVSAGETFATTDIPAGTYSSLLVLFSTVEVDKVYLSTMTDPVSLEALVSSEGSWCLKNSVLIRQNAVTALEVTLIPVVCADDTADFATGMSPSLFQTLPFGAGDPGVHGFFRLSDIQTDILSTQRTTSLSVRTSLPGTVSLFNSGGKKIAGPLAGVPDSTYTRYIYTDTDMGTGPYYVYYDNPDTSGNSVSLQFIRVVTSPKLLTLTTNIAHGTIGGGINSKYYPEGKALTLTETPENAGWTFVEWQINGVSSGSSPALPLTMDADKTVKAVFASAYPRYNLLYDINGGTFTSSGAWFNAAPADENDIAGGPAVTRLIPTSTSTWTRDFSPLPARYFTGWNTAADGSGNTYWPGDSITINDAVDSYNMKDMILYANWQLDDGPDFAGRAAASVIPTTHNVAVNTRGYLQFVGDFDYFALTPDANGTISMTVDGAQPALFTAYISQSDGTGYSSTGWNLDGTYVPVSAFSVTAGNTYYVYVLHQTQGYNVTFKTGGYTITTQFTTP